MTTYSPLLSLETAQIHTSDGAGNCADQRLIGIGLVRVEQMSDDQYRFAINAIAVPAQDDIQAGANVLMPWLTKALSASAGLMNWRMHDNLVAGLLHTCNHAKPSDAAELMRALACSAHHDAIDPSIEHGGSGGKSLGDIAAERSIECHGLVSEVFDLPIDEQLAIVRNMVATRAVATWRVWAMDNRLPAIVHEQASHALAQWQREACHD